MNSFLGVFPACLQKGKNTGETPPDACGYGMLEDDFES